MRERKSSPLGAGPHSDSKVPKDGTFGGGRYQNHELKKAIEDGDLAPVRQLLGGEAIDDAAAEFAGFARSDTARAGFAAFLQRKRAPWDLREDG